MAVKGNSHELCCGTSGCEDRGWVGARICNGGGWAEMGTGRRGKLGDTEPAWDPVGVRGLEDIQWEVSRGLRGKAGAGDRNEGIVSVEWRN